MSIPIIDTPSPIPSPPDSPYTLSERINISTRSIHSKLNKLIVLRLPLALPPCTTNPSTYISGILHIAPIYITFESLWQTLINTPHLPTSLKSTSDACDPESPLLDSRSVPLLSNTDLPPLVHTPKVCSRTHSLLSHIRLPGLLRAGRLRADIRVLTGTPEHLIDEHLEAISNNGKLAEFIAHTKTSVGANPHVLLAYAWVLYMALFSGGRYLRASLKDANGFDDFWNRDPSPVRPYSITRPASERRGTQSDYPVGPTHTRPSARAQSRSESGISKMVPALQFFNFEGNEDGEDIKLEFKSRLVEAEILLTSGEKEDIITEAGYIFKFMVEMIEELDQIMGTDEEYLENARLLKSNKFKASRDSVAVTQERLLRKRGNPADKEAVPPKKSTYLEMLVTEPVSKLMQLNNRLRFDADAKQSSKEFPDFKVSFSAGNEESTHEGSISVAWPMFSLPALTLLAVLIAWYYISRR